MSDLREEVQTCHGQDSFKRAREESVHLLVESMVEKVNAHPHLGANSSHESVPELPNEEVLDQHSKSPEEKGAKLNEPREV